MGEVFETTSLVVTTSFSSGCRDPIQDPRICTSRPGSSSQHRLPPLCPDRRRPGVPLRQILSVLSHKDGSQFQSARHGRLAPAVLEDPLVYEELTSFYPSRHYTVALKYRDFLKRILLFLIGKSDFPTAEERSRFQIAARRPPSMGMTVPVT